MPASSAYSTPHLCTSSSSSLPRPVDFACAWYALFFPFLLSLELHHVAHDGCISEEAFLGHAQYRREKHDEQQWREHAPLPETLHHVELIRALSNIIQPHACLHVVVKLADDGEHSRWHAKTSKDIPQKGLVDGLICFGEVDKAQAQGGVLLPRQFRPSSYCGRHVNRRALGFEPTLFLRHFFLELAVVTKATRDDFEGYFAGVSHEGDATVSCHTPFDISSCAAP